MKKIQNNFNDLETSLKKLSQTSLFCSSKINQNKIEDVEQLYNQMEAVIQIADLTADDILHNMGKLLTIMESPCLIWAPGLSPLLASHYNLCLGTILTLAGENRNLLNQYIDDLIKLKSKGIYMVTELDTGNNAMSLETQAHYNKEAKEFIINTPVVGACKFMPYLASNRHPKLAVVMARLWTEGKDCGVHPFVIQCRDHDGKLLSGIKTSELSVVDMHTAQVDHSITAFHEVRIPYYAFLGGNLNQVTSDGLFITKAKNKREIFFHSLSRVEWGKIVLVAALIPNFKIAISNAIEYSKNRTLNNKNIRFSLLDILIHKLELSYAYVSIIASISLYESIKQKCLTEKLSKSEFQHQAGIVKSMCVEIAREALHICMARTGAQGKMGRNLIVSAISLNDHTSTAEGDSLPVLMKIAKDLINKNLEPSQIANMENLSIKSVLKLQHIILYQIQKQKDFLSSKLENSMDTIQAWNDSTQIAKELAWAYGIYQTILALQNRPEVQRNFSIKYILDNAAWFSANGLITHAEFQNLRTDYETSCIQVFEQEALFVANEFDMLELVKRTPMGNKEIARKWGDIAQIF